MFDKKYCLRHHGRDRANMRLSRVYFDLKISKCVEIWGNRIVGWLGILIIQMQSWKQQAVKDPQNLLGLDHSDPGKQVSIHLSRGFYAQ